MQCHLASVHVHSPKDFRKNTNVLELPPGLAAPHALEKMNARTLVKGIYRITTESNHCAEINRIRDVLVNY